MEIEVNDIVCLRKKHPCGGDEWQVVRLGVDIRIKCLKCQKLVLLERGVLERRMKTLVSKSQTANKADKG
ncbi:MAG: DUF951 domain-containing protein [Dehalococcoidia bacterium]|jgi:hypothetical protein